MAKTEDFEVRESQIVFCGRVFSVTHDTAVEPGGVSVTRDIVRHAGSAVVLPRAADGRILLIRQFRLAARKPLWELVAGRLDPGETPEQAARRELAEETGYRAARVELLASYYSSPGFLDERMWLYLAEGLKRGRATPEEDERIERRWFTLEQAGRMVEQGKIEDGKLLIGYLLLKCREAALPRSGKRR